MKNVLRVLTAFAVLFVGTPALADSPTTALASCLVDHLDGKERKNLAKWIFFALAAHPEIKAYSSASSKDIRNSDEYVGKLLTRLLTVSCPDQLKAASSDGPLALQKAFGLVGQVAMQELMTNQDVMKSLTNYTRYADTTKITQIMNEK